MVIGTDMASELQTILSRMEQCTRILEGIVGRERQAVRQFDGETLMQLIDLRANCHREMSDLEQQCRALMANVDLPAGLGLEGFIELVAGIDADHFQSLRRQLYERMAHVGQESEENRVRMRAAFDVTTHLLQELGAVEKRQSYGPGGRW